MMQKGEGAIERLEMMIVLILAIELAISAVELWHGAGIAMAREVSAAVGLLSGGLTPAEVEAAAEALSRR